MLRTVKVPEQFVPLFQVAEKYVDEFFQTLEKKPEEGTIRIGGDRYVLIRCDSMSHSYVDQVKETIGEDAAYEFLYNFTRILGQRDARAFIQKMNVQSPPEKLSAGPIHFAYAGWALVDIHPTSRPSPDENYYLEYTHPNTFEAETYLRRSKEKAKRPVCIFSAGYSSGWCTESFGVEVHAREVTCVAKGDEACQFIMAPRDRLDEYEEQFFRARNLPYTQKKKKTLEEYRKEAQVGAFALNLVESHFLEEKISLEILAEEIKKALEFFAGYERANIAKEKILQLSWVSDRDTLKEKIIYVVDAQLKDTQMEQERLKKEMEIATKIQTAILPCIPTHPELEISCEMRPAEKVSGDYYDVLLDEHQRLWLGIGDVSGHGVTPGLIMMMAQSAFSSYISQSRKVSPSEVVVAINKILYNNIYTRLNQNDYMTLTLLVYEGDGNFRYAGKHLDIMVYRAGEKKCEPIPTDGVFAGILPDVSHLTEDLTFRLERGDFLVLYTDGIIEARNEDRELLDVERFGKIIEKNAERGSLQDIKNAILNDVFHWCNFQQEDDISIVVVRRK
ncbi:MAG: hypothetical protein D6805_09925 [Planctomycetota bacterium]|nr:MAG: hypothetical protein D6805_09925 [Planctomycetota bacterium]